MDICQSMRVVETGKRTISAPIMTSGAISVTWSRKREWAKGSEEIESSQLSLTIEINDFDDASSSFGSKHQVSDQLIIATCRWYR